MSSFSRLVTRYVQSLIRLRRAAERSISTPSSTASIDRLLRARMREVDAANAYRDASRKLFRAAVGARLTRRTPR